MKNKNELLDLLNSFLNSYIIKIKGLSPNTQRSYKYTFQLLFQFLESEKNIRPEEVYFETLKEETLLSFLEWLKMERGCSDITRNQRLAALSSFSSFAQSKSLDGVLVFRQSILSIPLIKVQKAERSFFTKEELKILFSLPDLRTKTGRRDRALLVFMYASGGRAQEICDLKIRDVTSSEGKATVTLHGKGKKARRISIPEKPSKELKDHIERTGKKNKLDAFVFSSQTREQMTVACIEEIYKKYIKLASRQYPELFRRKYSPHSMRHTTATHMVEAAVPLIVIKNFLGHSSVQTTEIYATITQQYLDFKTKEWNQMWLSSVNQNQKSSNIDTLSFLDVHYQG